MAIRTQNQKRVEGPLVCIWQPWCMVIYGRLLTTSRHFPISVITFIIGSYVGRRCVIVQCHKCIMHNNTYKKFVFCSGRPEALWKFRLFARHAASRSPRRPSPGHAASLHVARHTVEDLKKIVFHSGRPEALWKFSAKL
jgi:hypothetical protein